MHRFAHLLMIVVLPVIAACKPVLDIEARDYTEKATLCIKREAAAVAKLPIPVKTATEEVITRCSREVHSKEQALIASYPERAEQIRKLWQAITLQRYRQARNVIEHTRAADYARYWRPS